MYLVRLQSVFYWLCFEEILYLSKGYTKCTLIMWDFHLMITGGKKKRAEDIHMHGNLFFVNTMC